MRHVPIAEFQSNAADLLAAAEAGEDILITRDGKDVLRLSLTEDAQVARRRAAIEAMYALGQEIKAKYGPTTAAEIREWIQEGRP